MNLLVWCPRLGCLGLSTLKGGHQTLSRRGSREKRLSTKLWGLTFLTCACFALSFVNPVNASDWPHLLGPTRDAVYAGPTLAADWPKQGPAVVWQVNVGEGYSNPVVGEDGLIICHRVGDDLLVDCLDPKNGKKRWNFSHPMKFKDGAYFDNGPRPTPSIKDGKVYVHNTDGYLVCLDLKTGGKSWARNPKSEFQSSATWHGCVASPLVTDQAVILPVGGTNAAGVVAFARATGEIL